MKFDTKTEQFAADYKLPLLAEGEYETPYAVGIEPRTQDVWIAANMSDRILRFNPREESFTAYPSPTRVTFMRDFIFSHEGDVCTSNANLPSGAIEGGRGKFICLSLSENRAGR
jgi:streptogramin lyase